MYYITHGAGGLSVNVDVVFLVSPGNSSFHDRGYFEGGDAGAANDTYGVLLTSSGLSVTISGNNVNPIYPYINGYAFDGYFNIYYEANDVNSSNTAFRYTGDGFLNFSAQTGGYDTNPNAFVDNLIKVRADSTSYTDDQADGSKGGGKTLDIACFTASVLTITSDMSAALFANSRLRHHDYKGSSGDVSTASGNTDVASIYRVENFSVLYNFTGDITVTNQYTLTATATPAISGNTISSIGVLVNDAATVSGDFDGTIDVGVDGISKINRNVMSATYDSTKTNISASISNNIISAIAVKANSLTINNDFNSTWTASVDNLSFTALSSPAINVSFTGNSIVVAGYSGNSMNVNGKFDGNITSEIDLMQITLTGYQNPNSLGTRYHVISDNDFTVSGINLSGNLVTGNNIGTVINVKATNNKLTISGDAPGPSLQSYTYTNNYNTYGIKANTISVNGQFSNASNITLTSSMATDDEYVSNSILFTFATRAFGIYAQGITAQNYAGTISVTGGAYSCGIYVENTLTSTDKEPFNFNGSITVDGTGVASGMMGFYSGYNLRISGDITSNYEAITSGRWNVSNLGGYTYTYSIVDDYVEIAAGANIIGDIQLDAGTNTFVIDSNAAINGALRSNGGLSNVQFNLNGPATGATTLTTGPAYEDAMAVSTTKITFNLNDAVGGEVYSVVKSSNVTLTEWQDREFTLTYQGVSQRVSYGQTFDFSTISSYAVQAQVLYSASKGLYVNVVQQDAGYALNTVSNVTADTSAARAVTLNWSEITGADYYIVEYADNATFDKSVAKIVTGNSLTLTQLDNSIYYRIRAASDRGKVGDWKSGNATPGGTTPVVPLAPTSLLFVNPDKPTQGINTSAVKFNWEDQSNVQYYTLQYIISSEAMTPTNSDWATAYVRQTNSSEFLLTGLPEQSMVYWRVCATGNNGQTGEWANGNEFQSWTADKTPPQTGKGFTVTAKTTYDSTTNYESLKFTWGDIIDTQSGISSYIIVCTGAGGYTKTFTVRETDPLHPVVNSLSISDYVNANLGNSLRDGTYNFTFQAIDWVGNRTNLISGSNTFTVTPTVTTPTATLTTDVNKSTSANFTWRMSGDVASYTLQYVLGATADFTAANTITVSFPDISVFNGNNPTYTVNNLAATTYDTSYFWRVQATYSDGTNSSWSNGNSFYFDNTAPDSVSGTHALVDIRYNTSSSTNNWGAVTTSSVKTSVNAYLSWNAVTDDRSSVTYKVEVADNEYFNNSKSFSTTNAYLNFGDGTNGTIGAGYLSGMQNVYWRVYASDANGNTSDPTNGTYYQVINPYVGNVTLAPYFKWADVDNIAPTKVTISTQTYSSVDQYFNWSTSTSLEGIAGYNVVFTDKQGNVMYQTYTANTSIVFDVNSGLSDGTYKLSVQAVGCSGRTATASTKSVYIDFNGPTPVGNMSSSVFNKDVSVTWTVATDLFGIAAYQVRYTSGNDINASAVTTLTGTQLKLTNLANGNYTYQVRGIDKNGNLGQWTTGNFTIDTAEAAGQTFGTAKKMDWAQSSSQSFGGSWPANYFKYTATDTGVFTFTINNMAYGNGKFSVYNSNYKLIKTYSVTQGKDFSQLFNLTAGDYYVVMGSASNYNYGSYTINSANEYGVSDWTYTTKNSGGENYITGSVSDGVLGYGTPTNTFSFNLLNNGEINLSVNNVVGGTVSLTIYQTVNGVDKKLKTLSVSPKNVSGALKGLDLYAGDYKIVLANSQASQNVTAEYDLSIDGSYFPADTESLVMVDQPDGTVKGTVTDAFVGFGDPSDSFTFTATNQAEYNFALSDLSANATLTIYQTINGKQVKLTTVNAGDGKDGYFDTLLNSGDYMIVVNNPNPTKANTTFDLTVQSENNLINYTQPGDGNANGWLNAANSADYYDFTMYSTGKVTLSLDNVTASTKLSIIDSNNKVVATISTSSLISKDFNLAAGDYWLKVESTKTTAYDFNVLVA